MQTVTLIEDTYLGEGKSLTELQLDVIDYKEQGFVSVNTYEHPAVGLVVVLTKE